MLNKGPAVPMAAATAVLGVVIGFVGGNFMHVLNESPGGASTAAGSGGKMGGGGAPGGGGKMGGGAGGGAATPSTTLTRLVRNLAQIEKVQNKGLTAVQKKTMLPLLKEMQSADKLTDKDCEVKLASLQTTLTADQKTALEEMNPQRGGGMGGGKMGGVSMTPPGVGRKSGGPLAMPGGGGGIVSSGGMGGGGMGGGKMGAPDDPEKPFATDRNKKALEDLIGEAGK